MKKSVIAFVLLTATFQSFGMKQVDSIRDEAKKLYWSNIKRSIIVDEDELRWGISQLDIDLFSLVLQYQENTQLRKDLIQQEKHFIEAQNYSKKLKEEVKLFDKEKTTELQNYLRTIRHPKKHNKIVSALGYFFSSLKTLEC